MKILHIISSVDPRGGGPIEGVIQQAIQRRNAGIDVTIVSLDHPDELFLATIPIKVVPLGTRRANASWEQRYLPWRRYRYTAKMIPWLRANIRMFDVVVINGIWNFSALAARLSCVRSQVPYVVFTHGMLDPWFKRAYPIKTLVKQLSWWLCEGPLLNNAAAVMFTTADERDLARDAFTPYRVKEVVVGYGTSDCPCLEDAHEAKFRETFPELQRKPYLLFLGRLHKKKGCDLLIQAYAQLPEIQQEFDLVIAGPDDVGIKAQLDRVAGDAGVAHRIHWIGMVRGPDKWLTFKHAAAFVLPSHQENFGIVVAEAMACAVPVIISDKVNIWHTVVDGGGGVVDSDDLEGTIRSLRRFQRMTSADRKRMGEQGRATFLANFEMAKVVGTINETLRSLVTTKAKHV